MKDITLDVVIQPLTSIFGRRLAATPSNSNGPPAVKRADGQHRLQ